jgi:predicted Fe-Mo cluster-binding NifX family protein
MEENRMKIAFVTEDGQTISQHFGRALYYAVITVEDGQITGRQQRDKFAHQHGPGEHQHGAGHQGAEADKTHNQMLSPIGDCEVLLSRGMGYGAYLSLQQAGIKPMIVGVANIDEAALAYAAGTLVDHSERLH